MAAVLRMVGGLDRSRSQQVRDVRIQVGEGTVTLDVVADEDPQVDIWGAERRTDLFEKVFDRGVRIRWADRRGSRMHPGLRLAIRVAWDLFRIPLIHRDVHRAARGTGQPAA